MRKLPPHKVMEDDSSDEEPEQLQCKIILLGDGAVGKTSIALRFTEDHFATQYKQTIGLDFFMKRLVLPGTCPPTSPPRPRRSPLPAARSTKQIGYNNKLLSVLCVSSRGHPRRAPGVGHRGAVDRQ